jgi:DNA mismatch endonuclease (patch repair protein)
MENARQRDTSIEVELASELHNLGLSFESNVAPVTGTRSRPDLLFAAARIAVFVNGCFWHGCPEHGTWPKHNAAWWRTKIEANRERDVKNDAVLTKAGWIVLRYWEHDDPCVAAQEIAQRIRQLGRSASPSTGQI